MRVKTFLSTSIHLLTDCRLTAVNWSGSLIFPVYSNCSSSFRFPNAAQQAAVKTVVFYEPQKAFKARCCFEVKNIPNMLLRLWLSCVSGAGAYGADMKLQDKNSRWSSWVANYSWFPAPSKGKYQHHVELRQQPKLLKDCDIAFIYSYVTFKLCLIASTLLLWVESAAEICSSHCSQSDTSVIWCVPKVLEATEIWTVYNDAEYI